MRRSVRLPRVVSAADIGRANRARVLETLCDRGALSRADLARLAGVPRATISGIVQPLLDSGLLEEGEPNDGPARGGKPGRPLWFARGSGLSATASLDATHCRAALVNARGEILDQAEVSFDLDTYPTAETYARVVARALRSIRPRTGTLLGVGVAVPGVCDSTQGVVVGSVQIPAWTNYLLASRLTDLLGLNVVIDNDARCQALGEKWFGAGRGVSTFASIQTGEGLGVGLVLDGRVFRGEGGLTGEMGHTPLSPDGPQCRCGLRGCWETTATAGWLRTEAARQNFPEPDTMTSARLAEEVRSGDLAAAQLLGQYAENISAGLATLANLFGPQRLILHGEATTGGDLLLSGIRERTAARTLPYLRAHVDVVSSPLGDKASLLGAAALVLSETFRLAA